MAVEVRGCLPAEIVSDNFTARKTEELKTLITGMEELGVKWRFAKVGNAQDKGNVERFFRTFQSLICAEYPDYLGEGITSRNINGRRDADFIQMVYKTNFPTFEETKGRVAEMMKSYNLFNDGGRTSPKEIYDTFPSPYTIEVQKAKAAKLF